MFGWIVQGASEFDICEAIHETWPDQAAAPLIGKAMLQIAEQANPEKDLIRGWCIAATRRIYQEAMQVSDHQTALRAIKQLRELT